MPALRHALAIVNGVWKPIGFVQRDPIEVVGKSPCRKQSRHAPTDDNGVSATHVPPPDRRPQNTTLANELGG